MAYELGNSGFSSSWRAGKENVIASIQVAQSVIGYGLQRVRQGELLSQENLLIWDLFFAQRLESLKGDLIDTLRFLIESRVEYEVQHGGRGFDRGQLCSPRARRCLHLGVKGAFNLLGFLLG